jgi:hypothetical protein
LLCWISGYAGYCLLRYALSVHAGCDGLQAMIFKLAGNLCWLSWLDLYAAMLFGWICWL